MNNRDYEILLSLKNKSYKNQREIAKETGYSLGAVNKSLSILRESGLINNCNVLTDKADSEILTNSPQNAIILAAGFGMRMVPINTEIPKALLNVKGEILIERMINQLHEVGINDIYIVIGFMKERFEYLIDKFNVHLIINNEYSSKNNLHSLALASCNISNSYIIPSDLYFIDNPFKKYEINSWYMVNDVENCNSKVRVNQKQELVKASCGNKIVGLAYLNKQDSETIKQTIQNLDKKTEFNNSFWEEALYKNNKIIVPAKVISYDKVVEINTYEQLREFDNDSNHLKTDAITIIAKQFKCKESDVQDIKVLKKGMTNRSFLFSVNNEKYIMRIPGEGTQNLIKRKEEMDVFHAISGLGFCDDPIYMNSKNGYKITKFLNNVRTCDPSNPNDVKKAMEKLVQVHNSNLKVEHTFDIFKQINFYESLWDNKSSMYIDYQEVKEKVFSLKPFIDSQQKSWCLTHIDAVPDNFLFYEEDGREYLQLIDWEYAGMQDPHVDIAMFCLYSMYDKHQVDQLIDIYFKEKGEKCSSLVRAKIYAYISTCGLLWSNWCEFKAQLGIEFGEYSFAQYRFAKEYYKYAIEVIYESR